MSDRKKISKMVRKEVYHKYDGRCAYCGEHIEYKDMQVDNIEAVARGGGDDFENLMTACRLCNHYERTMTLENFRKQIGLLTGRLHEREYIYRLALKYGRIVENDEPIEFYFEQFKVVE